MLISNYNNYINEYKHIFIEQDNDSLLSIKKIVGSVLESIDEVGSDCDMGNVIYNNFRNTMLSGAADGSIKILPECKEINEFILNGRIDNNSCAEHELNIFLSFLRRKDFDYFINKYYFFKDIPKNKRIERRIRKTFCGKGNIRMIYTLERMHSKGCNDNYYIQYLMHISNFFLEQIGKKGALIPHPDSLKFYILQRNYIVRRKSLPIIIAISTFFLLYLFLMCSGVEIDFLNDLVHSR